MNNQLLDGQSFNAKYQGKIFIKLTNVSENHNGYQFRTGLNIDSLKFNPSGECQPGGIYFCLLEDLSLWLNYGGQQMFYVRFVTIASDAQVWIEINKFKADRLILSDRVKIGDLKVWEDNDYCLAAVQRKGLSLCYVKEQTPEICLAAVEEDECALQYVKEQTPEICLAAVEQDAYTLRYVKEQTPEICWVAVQQDVDTLQYAKAQTPEICLAAVQQNYEAFSFVIKKTPEICCAFSTCSE